MLATNQEILEELDKLAKKNEEEKDEKDVKTDNVASEKADDSVDYGDELSLDSKRQ